jgi:hypothetical protein
MTSDAERYESAPPYPSANPKDDDDGAGRTRAVAAVVAGRLVDRTLPATRPGR